MRAFVFLALVPAALAGCGGAQTNVQERPKPRLALRVDLERKAINPGSKAIARIQLQNVSSASVHVNSGMRVKQQAGGGELGLFVLGPQSTLLQPKSTVNSNMASKSWSELKPGEMLEVSCDLSDYFDMNRPGKYIVEAVYENRENPPDNRSPVFVGCLMSNRVVLEVRP